MAVHSGACSIRESNSRPGTSPPVSTLFSQTAHRRGCWELGRPTGPELRAPLSDVTKTTIWSYRVPRYRVRATLAISQELSVPCPARLCLQHLDYLCSMYQGEPFVRECLYSPILFTFQLAQLVLYYQPTQPRSPACHSNIWRVAVNTGCAPSARPSLVLSLPLVFLFLIQQKKRFAPVHMRR